MIRFDRSVRIAVAAAVALLAAGRAPGLSAADKCEADKLKRAALYGACRLKAESQAVKKALPADYTKCDAKLGPKWTAAETKAGGLCPTNGDLAIMQGFIGQHADDVATALGGGGLPTCPADLATCGNDLAACQAEPRGQRTKTRQTTCYNGSGGVIPCAGTGQDGEVQAGLTASFSDNGDGTVTDQRTGLTWEKLSDDGSVHDKDTYETWVDAFAKIDALNSAVFAGHADWRLPNVNELQSLVDYGAGGSPWVHAPLNAGCMAGCTVLTCSCTVTGDYWTSTTVGNATTNAWIVGFGSGGVIPVLNKNGYAAIRAVRGGGS
ncbi:DUF1566 domain-containing protein [bacterium]|nr:DUF1566 domain-containing protein [bacterium]